MKLPTSSQTIFNFSINRVLNALDPIFQLDVIDSSIDSTNQDFTNGITLPPFLDTKSKLVSSSRHLVFETQYLNYLSTMVGFSNIAIFEYIAESRLGVDKSYMAMFESYKQLAISENFELRKSNRLFAILYPFDYIFDYSQLTMANISSITLTPFIEDTIPSSEFYTDTIFIYDTAYSYIKTALTDSLWISGTLNVKYFSFLQISAISSGTPVTSTIITSDLSAFFSNNLTFYNRITDYFLGSIAISDDMSIFMKNNIRNAITAAIPSVIYPKFANYFSTNMQTFISNVVTRYIGMFVHYHALQLTITGISGGSLSAQTPTSEYVFAESIENSSVDDSDTLFTIADIAADISENPIEFLNNTTGLYQIFVDSLDLNIKEFLSTLTLPDSVRFNDADDPIAVSAYFESYFSSISFSTTDPINARLLSSAIGLEFSGVASSIFSEIFTVPSDFVRIYSPIEAVFGTGFDIGMSLTERASRFMSILTAAFNYDLVKNPSAVLPTTLAAFNSSEDYTLPVPISNFNSLNWFSTHVVSDASKLTITRLLVAAYYEYKMNASIDSFSIDKINI